MDIEYYVLGKKDNPMLLSYFERFKNLLKEQMTSIAEKSPLLREKIEEVLKKDSDGKFISSPDISSLIEYLYRELILKEPQHIGEPIIYEKKLENEINIFLSGDINGLAMNKGEKIYGTDIRLTNIDLNPYNQFEAHPDHAKDNAFVGWGQASESDWLSVYNKTFKTLENVDVGVYDELNTIIKKIIPLGTSKGIHNSCSYKECIGHLYMGYTLDAGSPEINNLEAIIHESSHNKLNLIMHFDPLILNDYREIYYSPYRPDPRHMHGIYLGLHAFAPTIYIIMGAYNSGLIKDDFWKEKILLYHIKNKLALKVIEKFATLTTLGIEILQEMKYVMKLSDERLKGLNLDEKSISNVNALAKKHFANVIERYGSVLR